MWQDGYDAIKIHSKAFLEEKMDYIHTNPVRAEIVATPEEYLYSSATDYTGGKGLVDMEFVSCVEVQILGL